VVDVKLAAQLAEVGVILLMFGVGIHFSVRDLLAVRAIAIPGALAQIAVATALGAGIALAWGWTIGAGLVFGLALSVASTVVLLRQLEAQGNLKSRDGQIAVGWLVVEDLAMVLTLVLLPALAGALGGQSADTVHDAAPANLWVALGLTLGRVALFVFLILLVGPRVVPWLLKQVQRTGSRELFTLVVDRPGPRCGVWFGEAFRRLVRPRCVLCRDGHQRNRPEPSRRDRPATVAGRVCRALFSWRWECSSTPPSWFANRCACSSW